MKKFVLAAFAATILAGTFSVQAADRKMPFDGYKFFEEVSQRTGQ